MEKIGFIIILYLIIGQLMDVSEAGGPQIVSAARKQIGKPYVWGGGGVNGPTNGGFDCSGLAQYAVKSGTGKTIARVTSAQYNDKKCKKLSYSNRAAGDLVFFSDGKSVSHVGIVSTRDKMIHAPRPGQTVKEVTIYSKGRMGQVVRCW